MITKEINALIISAGFSSRMKSFKPLMLFEELPFIISVICKTSQICRNLYIVTGYREEDVREEILKWLDKQPDQQALKSVNLSITEWKKLHLKVNFIYNEHYQHGMFSSLKIGLKHIGKTDWILYHFVDQPHIPADFYPLFKEQLDDQYHWIQPCYQKTNAHPIMIRWDLGEKISKSENVDNLKSFSQNQHIKKKFWNCDYPQVLSDFDTPDSLYQQGELNGNI